MGRSSAPYTVVATELWPHVRAEALETMWVGTPERLAALGRHNGAHWLGAPHGAALGAPVDGSHNATGSQ